LTYPDIAEDRKAEYPHCYCPSNPKSYEVVFALIDEVMEAFKPLRFVSMGHDEVYSLGECPLCRGKSREQLFTEDVLKIHSYLKEKGLGMMIWADMLHSFRWYSSPKAEIPRDIVLLDFVWYFRTDEDIEDGLLARGFRVIMGNLYSSHYTRFGARISKTGMIGGEVSTWTATGEYELGKKGKLFDFIYTANMLWSDRYSENLRWSYTRRIAEKLTGRRYPSLRERKRCVPIDLSRFRNAGILDEAGSRGFILSTLARGKVSLRNVPFQIGEGWIIAEGERAREKRYPSLVELPINQRADSLLFLHALAPRTAYRPAFAGSGEGSDGCGSYRITYGNGTEELIPIDPSWNIGEWDRKYGEVGRSGANRHGGYFTTYGADPFWEGKTPDGRNITIYGYEWLNPHPDGELKLLRVEAGSLGDSAVILIALTAIRA
jgi:hypothetical protein